MPGDGGAVDGLAGRGQQDGVVHEGAEQRVEEVVGRRLERLVLLLLPRRQRLTTTQRAASSLG